MTATTPQPGSLIGGKYRVERLLGEGGMGSVFSAVHTTTGKRVAIKWMHADVAEDPDARQRFVREAQASARVRHPNVVDVYDVMEEGDALFLVMEFLEGESLADLMDRGTTDIAEMIALLILAMRGVAAAHRQGIVHRDIKPENIFLARVDDDIRPIPKVLDFGISKLTGVGDTSMTKTGIAIGTPLYMSIEQLSGVRDIDERTDIYAFGVILYQVATGQAPFSSDSYAVLIAKIMTEPAPPPQHVRPDIPRALAKVIERAMAKDRNLRIPTIDELIRELEPLSSDAGYRARMNEATGNIPRVATPKSAASHSDYPTAIMQRASTPRDVVAARPRTPRASHQQAPAPVMTRQRWISVGLTVLALVVAIEMWWLLREPVAPPAAAADHIVEPAAPDHVVEPIVPTVAMPPAEVPVAIDPPAAIEPPPAAPRPATQRTSPTQVAPQPTPAARPRTTVASPTPPAPVTTAPKTAPPTTKTSTKLRAGAPRSDEF